MTTGRTEGKPWEIAWGELRWEGAIWKRRESVNPWEIACGESSGVKERYGGEPVGNSMWGEVRWEGAMRE